jgi:hypothetical protein
MKIITDTRSSIFYQRTAVMALAAMIKGQKPLPVDHEFLQEMRVFVRDNREGFGLSGQGVPEGDRFFGSAAFYGWDGDAIGMLANILLRNVVTEVTSRRNDVQSLF